MGLREKSARGWRLQQQLAGALVIVVLAGTLAVAVPNRRSLASTNQKITVSEANAAENAKRVTALPKLIEEVKHLRNQVDRYKPLLGRSDVERAMDQISKIKESTSVTNYAFKTLREDRKSLCVEQPLEISFTADFIDAMSLIQRIEAMDRLTRMRELTIRTVGATAKGERGIVNVKMQVSLFYADGIQ